MAPYSEVTMRSSVGALLKIAGLLAVTVASSWAALQLLNLWDVSRSGSGGAGSTGSSNLVQIAEATYGLSCLGRAPGVKAGNVTDAVAKICEKAIDDCKFVASVGDFGDPAPGCAKDLSISWRCGTDQSLRRLRIPAEADGKLISISCLPR